jgi:hypothetical protein
MPDKKIKAALEIVDRVCADFRGNRQEHTTIQASLQIIYVALDPKTDEKKVEVPRKALPRDRKRKTKKVRNRKK